MPAPLDTLPDLETFTYDGVGNRTMTGYAHDANHRMRASPGHSYDYDEDGNQRVQDPGQAGQAAYTWDLDNRLSNYASGSTSASYAYDPVARRLKKSAGGATTFYLWGENRLLAEYGASGARQSRYAYHDGWSPDEVATGPSLGSEARRTFEADRLDTPRLGLSASGVAQWRGTYEAYGRAHLDPDPDGDLQVALLNVRLPGQYFDGESELHYNRYRQYDPSRGRYWSYDPLGQQGGINLYVYVAGLPTRLKDPLGLVPPSNVHPGILRDFCKNLAEAMNMSLAEFIDAVRPGGRWDYKIQADDAGVVDQTNKYDDSGNYHYGAISAARGMSLEFSLRGAGLAQILAGTSSHDYLFGPLSDPLDLFPNDDVDWGWPWGSPPFADDPTDQRWITEGYRDLESILSQCRCMLSN
jgi:RHS repeat-associated protein